MVRTGPSGTEMTKRDTSPLGRRASLLAESARSRANLLGLASSDTHLRDGAPAAAVAEGSWRGAVLYCTVYGLGTWLLAFVACYVLVHVLEGVTD